MVLTKASLLHLLQRDWLRSLARPVNFVADYNVTGEAATAAVDAMNEGDVVLLQNTRFRGAEETKNGEEFSKELADLADVLCM